MNESLCRVSLSNVNESLCRVSLKDLGVKCISSQKASRGRCCLISGSRMQTHAVPASMQALLLSPSLHGSQGMQRRISGSTPRFQVRLRTYCQCIWSVHEVLALHFIFQSLAKLHVICVSEALG